MRWKCFESIDAGFRAGAIVTLAPLQASRVRRWMHQVVRMAA
jgi:hypothetical protein